MIADKGEIMAGHPKGKTTLCGYVDDNSKAYVFLRAHEMGWSGSQYTTAILRWWLKQGAPPVWPTDIGNQSHPYVAAVDYQTMLGDTQRMEGETKTPAKAPTRRH